MLDSDLAELYQVLRNNVNKAVTRTLGRFPDDFMFQLTKEEVESLRFQIGTSNEGRGGHLGNRVIKEFKTLKSPRRRKTPYRLLYWGQITIGSLGLLLRL
jgi:hypothetical protein